MTNLKRLQAKLRAYLLRQEPTKKDRTSKAHKRVRLSHRNSRDRAIPGYPVRANGSGPPYLPPDLGGDVASAAVTLINQLTTKLVSKGVLSITESRQIVTDAVDFLTSNEH